MLNRPFVGIMALVLVVACSLPSYGGLLVSGSGYAYSDGLGPGSGGAWYGSTPYSSFSLVGTVDWVVIAPGKFALAFPGSPYSPPANELVYAYQINNTGNSDASTLDTVVVSDRPHDTIGSFPLTGLGGNPGLPPVSSSFVASPPTYDFAHWLFGTGIVTGQSSSGLAYASPNTPEYQFGSLINSGLGADADPLPSPSTSPIPEPSSAALFTAFGLLLMYCGRFWRGFR
jgi:hypothetical protein